VGCWRAGCSRPGVGVVVWGVLLSAGVVPRVSIATTATTVPERSVLVKVIEDQTALSIYTGRVCLGLLGVFGGLGFDLLASVRIR
jgi:hypothetical protein